MQIPKDTVKMWDILLAHIGSYQKAEAATETLNVFTTLIKTFTTWLQTQQIWLIALNKRSVMGVLPVVSKQFVQALYQINMLWFKTSNKVSNTKSYNSAVI